MTTTETLIAGNIYDVTTLEHVGWTDGDGTSHEGYSAADYFDVKGRYLGPDRHGIEPTFTSMAASKVEARHEEREVEGTGWYVYVDGQDAGGPFESEDDALEHWRN